MEIFDQKELKKLYVPSSQSNGEDNGSVMIIGGSKLFHGAPLFALKVASRVVDMVFFTSPEPSVGRVAERIKSKLLSFIWVPWEETEKYVEKSDAVLIGPGLMRYRSDKLQAIGNKLDEEGEFTKQITEKLLKKFPSKKWVIDAGSLQTIEPEWIPQGAVITPNQKEFEFLFKESLEVRGQSLAAKLQALSSKYRCIIVYKGPVTVVSDGRRTVTVDGGNAGLTKGGTGDTLAGLAVALLAKNNPFLATCAAAYLVKAAADEWYKKVGVNYNADDLAERIPEVLAKVTRSV